MLIHELNAILAIAYRDFTKLIRDRTRLIASLIFPIIFIGALGGSLQANWGNQTGYNLITFIFTGVMAQVLFQSTAAGVISLVEDRVNDFSQEMFVSPISRFSIIIGKIIGETCVSLIQAVAVILFGLIMGVPLTPWQLLRLAPFLLIVCLLGGAFGILVLSNLSTERKANQIFPFVIFPQFFLAGVFSPIRELPWYLWILSRIAPMTYAVDLVRGIFYQGNNQSSLVVLHSPFFNLLIISMMMVLFATLGTFIFVRNERNR